MAAPVVASGRSIYRSISGHKILTANHVLSMQQINPSHHLISVVYVYPKRLAGSFEGHWFTSGLFARCAGAAQLQHEVEAGAPVAVLALPGAPGVV